MHVGWLLAVIACGELAWAGIAYGVCDQEILQKLLDRGFSKDEILRMCGQAGGQPPVAPNESRESNKDRGKLTAIDFINSGKAKFDKQHYESALADYTQAITLDPKNADAYLSRGHVHGV